MAVQGNFPISQLPLVPQAQAATQTQVAGTPGVADRTITTPQDGLTLTVTPGGSIVVSCSQQGPQDIVLALNDVGISATLDRFGQLQLPNASSVSGNANMTHALGLS